MIKDWPEKIFGISLEEKVAPIEESSVCKKLPENEKKYALFTDCSATLQERIRDQVSYNKLLKETVNQVSLQRWRPSSWL